MRLVVCPFAVDITIRDCAPYLSISIPNERISSGCKEGNVAPESSIDRNDNRGPSS